MALEIQESRCVIIFADWRNSSCVAEFLIVVDDYSIMADGDECIFDLLSPSNLAAAKSTS